MNWNRLEFNTQNKDKIRFENCDLDDLIESIFLFISLFFNKNFFFEKLNYLLLLLNNEFNLHWNTRNKFCILKIWSWEGRIKSEEEFLISEKKSVFMSLFDSVRADKGIFCTELEIHRHFY